MYSFGLLTTVSLRLVRLYVCLADLSLFHQMAVTPRKAGHTKTSVYNISELESFIQFCIRAGHAEDCAKAVALLVRETPIESFMSRVLMESAVRDVGLGWIFAASYVSGMIDDLTARPQDASEKEDKKVPFRKERIAVETAIQLCRLTGSRWVNNCDIYLSRNSTVPEVPDGLTASNLGSLISAAGRKVLVSADDNKSDGYLDLLNWAYWVHSAVEHVEIDKECPPSKLGAIDEQEDVEFTGRTKYIRLMWKVVIGSAEQQKFHDKVSFCLRLLYVIYRNVTRYTESVRRGVWLQAVMLFMSKVRASAITQEIKRADSIRWLKPSDADNVLLEKVAEQMFNGPIKRPLDKPPVVVINRQSLGSACARSQDTYYDLLEAAFKTNKQFYQSLITGDVVSSFTIASASHGMASRVLTSSDVYHTDQKKQLVGDKDIRLDDPVSSSPPAEDEKKKGTKSSPKPKPESKSQKKVLDRIAALEKEKNDDDDEDNNKKSDELKELIKRRDAVIAWRGMERGTPVANGGASASTTVSIPLSLATPLAWSGRVWYDTQYPKLIVKWKDMEDEVIGTRPERKTKSSPTPAAAAKPSSADDEETDDYDSDEANTQFRNRSTKRKASEEEDGDSNPPSRKRQRTDDNKPIAPKTLGYLREALQSNQKECQKEIDNVCALGLSEALPFCVTVLGMFSEFQTNMDKVHRRRRAQPIQRKVATKRALAATATAAPAANGVTPMTDGAGEVSSPPKPRKPQSPGSVAVDLLIPKVNGKGYPTTPPTPTPSSPVPPPPAEQSATDYL